MKRLLLIALAAFALAVPGICALSPATAQADIRCTPTPRMVLACREQGGTFNFANCECRLPYTSRAFTAVPI
jgi:hypothetical protein